MHRDIADDILRIRRALELRLWPAVHAERVPADVTVTHLPGEPEPFHDAVARTFEPFPPGSPWGPAWSTSWLRVEAEVPAAFAGRELEMLVDLGFNTGGPGFQAEGLAYDEGGAVVKGVEPRTTHLPLGTGLRAGERVRFFVEAAANPRIPGPLPTPNGDVRTRDERPLYVFTGAWLAAFDREVWSLALDVQVLLELALEQPERTLRRRRIVDGLGAMLDLLDPLDVAASATRCREAIAPLLDSPAQPTEVEVTAVGHAHIDSAWLWPVRETKRKCARTFANVLQLAERYPELVFACSSAQQYEWVKQTQPGLWRRLLDGVASGAFVPVGGMWVESDTTMPGSEGLVRQLTEGASFFADELGVECEETWLPDSFGYSGALPQLCRLAGSRGFLSQKMSWNATNTFPHSSFWWEGIDGTRVFTHFPPAATYGSELSGSDLARSVRDHRDLGPSGTALLPFGWSDGGGGPTREMLEVARRTRDLEGSPRVVQRRPAEFFERAIAENPDAPVWRGEMYLEYHRGTFTSQVAMKQGNRRMEHLLVEAEAWSAAASLRTGAAYPYDELQQLWRGTLLNQFHDILPGSSIAWVHREAREQYRDLGERAEALIARALHALAGEGERELVANPAPHERRGIPATALAAASAEAGAVPITVVEEGDRHVLSSAHVRVVVGPEGTLRSVRDLAADREVLTAGSHGNVLELYQDTPNNFDAWDIDAFYVGSRQPVTDPPAVVTTGMRDGVPHVRVERHLGRGSSAVQEISLAPEAARVDLRTHVDWHEQHTLLKVAFDLDLHAERYAAETQFGHVWRTTDVNTSWDAARFETMAHRWVHVPEPGYGVSLINTGTYGHDVGRGSSTGDARGAGTTRVGLSLLRSPVHPDPETDQGEHEFSYALLVGTDLVDTVREGYATAMPERTVRGGSPAEPLVQVDDPGVVVTAVKLATDRSGDVIVRCYEATGARRRPTLRLGIPVALVQITDLHERPNEEVAALTSVTRDGDLLVLTLAPFQVVTLRFS